MTRIKNKIHYTALSFLTLLFLVLIKLPSISEPGDLLWAEDGNVFINDVLSLNFKSIIKSYAGYIHLYPRLWSLFLMISDLSTAPAIFLIGWLTAVFFTGYAFITTMLKLGFKFYETLFLASLIFLQPSTGEVYFTITNAQWFLGFALGLLILLHNQSLNHPTSIALIVLLCLTGPFVVLLIPALLVKILLMKKTDYNHILAFILIPCTLIQVYYFATSDRPVSPTDLNAFNWLEAFYIFASFGMQGWFIFLSAFLWLFIIYTLIDFIGHRIIDERKIMGVLIFIFGITIYVAALYASKDSPNSITPIGGGSRYFWIPYATIFTAAALFCKNSIQKLIVYGLIISICTLGFHSPTVGRQSTDYKANLKLNKIIKNDIKINPFWEVFPDRWKINSAHIHQEPIDHIKSTMTFHDITSHNGLIELTDDGFTILDEKNDPHFTLKLPHECIKYDYLSLLIDATRQYPTYMQLYWTDKSPPDFSENNSRIRFSGSNLTTTTFAIKKISNIKFIRLDPSTNKFIQNIHKIELYCY